MNRDLLIATFNENISYIETSHPKLFSKLVALDNAVTNGHYQEQYELVFDNEYFDVLEKATQNHLYGKNSDDYASLVASSIDYGLENNLFNCSPEHKIDDEKLEYYKNLPLLKDYMSGIAPIFHYTQKRMIGKNSLQSIQKFIFFGVGLGLHLQKIDEKIKASQYLIVEDDLELFRLSLFIFNYKELSKTAKLYFCVFDDETEFSQMSEVFLKEDYQFNKYIKYFEMLSHSESKRQEFHLSVANQAHLRFSHAAMLQQSLLPLEYLGDSYQFLQKGVSFKNSFFEDKPFLLLGAGPSLQKNMDLLQKRKDSFVVVAVSATLKLLEKENIVPDIIVHLDAFEASLKHFELNSIEFIQNSICIFSAKTHPLISLRLKRENIFFYEDFTKYIKNSFRPSASCVGSMAYQILLYLKVKNIYLLGLDLAVDAQTGKTHSDGHVYAKTLDLKGSAYKEEEIEYKKHLIEIEGNRGINVKTTPHFKTSIDTINLSTQMLKEESQTVVNLGDGAAFYDVSSENFENIEIKNTMLNTRKELLNVFSNHRVLNKEEEMKKLFKGKLENALQSKKTLLAFTTLNITTLNEYKVKLLELVDSLTGDEDEDLQRVYSGYFRYLLPYIFDFFNREGVKINEEDFRVLNDMLVEYLVKIS